MKLRKDDDGVEVGRLKKEDEDDVEDGRLRRMKMGFEVRGTCHERMTEGVAESPQSLNEFDHRQLVNDFVNQVLKRIKVSRDGSWF